MAFVARRLSDLQHGAVLTFLIDAEIDGCHLDGRTLTVDGTPQEVFALLVNEANAVDEYAESLKKSDPYMAKLLRADSRALGALASRALRG